jgi:hypothetical protein
MIGRVEWKEPFLRIEAAYYIKGSPLSDLAERRGGGEIGAGKGGL